MPTVLSIRRINVEFSDLYRRIPIERSTGRDSRAPGLHQSDVLKHIALKIGKLKPGERLEEEYPWRMAMGNMWEEFYFSLVPTYTWQPGELIIESAGGPVAMNCDGIGIPSHFDEVAVIETKCTECKIVETEEALLEKFGKNWWVYHHQGRCYCRGYGPRVVVWPMLHYRGDWCGSGPVVMEYTVRFSDDEIEQSWAMVGRYAAELNGLDEDVEIPF